MKKRLSIFALLSRSNRSKPSARLTPLTRRVFAMEFISELVVIYPFYAIMFGERGGVSAGGVGVLLATWLVVAVAAEVPTGVLADKMSKKWAIVLGKLLQTLAFGIWLFAPNFTGYFIGFVIWGVGEAFSSGAFQAYLYESLPDSDKQSFGKIYARTSSMTMLAYALAYLGAFIIGPQYSLLLVLSIAASAAALGVALSLPDNPDKKDEVEVEIRPTVLATAFRAIREKPGLKEAFVLAIVVQGLAGAMFEYLPLYYQQVGTPIGLVPLLLAVGSGLTALLFWWMHRVERQLTAHRLAILLVATGLFSLTFISGTAVAVMGVFLFTRVLRMMVVTNESAIQHQAASAARATIGSLYSFAGKLISAGILVAVGLFAVDNSMVVPLRWGVIAAAGVFALCVAYFWLRRKQPLPV